LSARAYFSRKSDYEFRDITRACVMRAENVNRKRQPSCQLKII